jgi:hypothetical protein
VYFRYPLIVHLILSANVGFCREGRVRRGYGLRSFRLSDPILTTVFLLLCTSTAWFRGSSQSIDHTGWRGHVTSSDLDGVSSLASYDGTRGALDDGVHAADRLGQFKDSKSKQSSPQGALNVLACAQNVTCAMCIRLMSGTVSISGRRSGLLFSDDALCSCSEPMPMLC